MSAVAAAVHALHPDYAYRWRAEGVMVKQLHTLTGQDVEKGITTIEQRRAHIRDLILKYHLTDKVIGRHAGRDVTWAACFHRAYGVALAELA